MIAVESSAVKIEREAQPLEPYLCGGFSNSAEQGCGSEATATGLNET